MLLLKNRGLPIEILGKVQRKMKIISFDYIIDEKELQQFTFIIDKRRWAIVLSHCEEKVLIA